MCSIPVAFDYDEAEITKDCRARNIHLTHVKCIAAIEAWIAVRLERSWGISSEAEYRGLLPDSRLVMTHKGRRLSLRSSVACWTQG